MPSIKRFLSYSSEQLRLNETEVNRQTGEEKDSKDR